MTLHTPNTLLPSFTALATLCLFMPQLGHALPTGATAIDGNITFDANNLNQTSNRGIAEYTSFDIDAGETYNVNNGSGATLIRDTQSKRTDIKGNLNATGKVMLVNGNGVFIGQNAVVNVGSIVATTSDIDNANFMAGNDTFDKTTDRKRQVTNTGTIITATGGTAALIANGGVKNTGTILANAGNIHLASADKFVVDFDGDGIVNFEVSDEMETALSRRGETEVSVENSGNLIAENGTIAMTASAANSVIDGVINTSGIVRASQAVKRGGKITLSADTVDIAGNMDTKRLNLDAAVASNTAGEVADQVNMDNRNSISDGIDLTKTGGKLNLAKGTYTQTSTLNVDKSITIKGKNKSKTVIDSSAVTGYSMHVTAQDVTLNKFTLKGGAHYGIKVDRGSNSSAPLSNFTLKNAVIKGSGRTEVDLNGVDGALIENVTANGQGTSGNGFSITGSTNVVLDNVKTDGQNAWGGIAIYPDGYYGSVPTVVQVLRAGGVLEANPLYVQSQGNVTTSLYAPEFNFAVRNDAFRPEASEFTFYQRTEADAGAFATSLGFNADSTIQTITHDAATPLSTVDADHYIVANDQMSIGKAIDEVVADGLVEVRDGTYVQDKTLFLDKALTLKGESEMGTIIDGSSVGSGFFGFLNPAVLYATASDITLSDLTVEGGRYVGVMATRDLLDLRNPVDNFTMKDVTVAGSRDHEISLVGINNAQLTNVTANGEGTDGNAIRIMGSTGVTLDGISTDGGNQSGGVYISTGGLLIGRDTDVQVLNASGIAENNAVYMNEDGRNVSIYAPEFDFAVKSDSENGYWNDFTFFQRTEADGTAFSTALNSDATMQTVTHDSSTPVSNLDADNFIVGAGMFINPALQSVATDGLVTVRSGTFNENLSIGNGLRLVGAGEGNTVISGFTPAQATGNITIAAGNDNVFLQDFTVTANGLNGLQVNSGNVAVSNVALNGNGVGNGIDLNAPQGTLVTENVGVNDFDTGLSVTGDAVTPEGEIVALLNNGTVFDGNQTDIVMDADGYVTDARLATFNDAAAVTDIPGRVDEPAGVVLLPEGARDSLLDGDSAVDQSQRLVNLIAALRARISDLGADFDIFSLLAPAAGEGVPTTEQQLAEINRQLTIILQNYLDTGDVDETEDAIQNLLRNAASQA